MSSVDPIDKTTSTKEPVESEYGIVENETLNFPTTATLGGIIPDNATIAASTEVFSPATIASETPRSVSFAAHTRTAADQDSEIVPTAVDSRQDTVIDPRDVPVFDEGILTATIEELDKLYGGKIPEWAVRSVDELCSWSEADNSSILTGLTGDERLDLAHTRRLAYIQKYGRWGGIVCCEKPDSGWVYFKHRVKAAHATKGCWSRWQFHVAPEEPKVLAATTYINSKSACPIPITGPELDRDVKYTLLTASPAEGQEWRDEAPEKERGFGGAMIKYRVVDQADGQKIVVCSGTQWIGVQSNGAVQVHMVTSIDVPSPSAPAQVQVTFEVKKVLPAEVNSGVTIIRGKQWKDWNYAPGSLPMHSIDHASDNDPEPFSSSFDECYHRRSQSGVLRSIQDAAKSVFL